MDNTGGTTPTTPSRHAGPAPKQPPIYDPVLKKTVQYDRQEVISTLTHYYKLFATLPHIDPDDLAFPPPEGWPQITRATLEQWGVYRTDEVIELLRHIPYFRNDHREPKLNWIGPECLVSDWRTVETEQPADGTRPRRPAHVHMSATDYWEFPEWVIALTVGRDKEMVQLLLDTTDGTVTKCCTFSGGTAEYPEDDPRNWRNYMTDDTLPIGEFFESWWDKYLTLTWVGMPDSKLSGILRGWIQFDRPGEMADADYDPADDPRPSGRWDNSTRGIVAIYNKCGWPDSFQRDKCREALLEYEREHPKWHLEIEELT